jgi:hypothetical protein
MCWTSAARNSTHRPVISALDLIARYARGSVQYYPDEQELSVACLHVLQAAVAYVNTLLVQDVLAEPAWADALTAEDRRGLTPLFWTHVAPYGEVKFNMTKRLALRPPPPPAMQLMCRDRPARQLCRSGRGRPAVLRGRRWSPRWSPVLCWVGC